MNFIKVYATKGFWAFRYTVDSRYLEQPLSRTSLYLELKSQSLCVGCNLFFSLYLELSLSRTNSQVPCEFNIERVNCNENVINYIEIFITSKRLVESVGV